MSRRIVSCLMLLMLIGSLVVVRPGSFASGQELGVLRTPLDGEPSSLDPYFAVDVPSASVIMMMYTSLVFFDGTGKLVPMAAKNWDVSPNGLIYTFHLRPMQFHSGRAVTAADWKWSFDHMSDPALRAPIADFVLSSIQGYPERLAGAPEIAGIRVLDPMTLQFVVNPARRGGFLNRLAHYAAVVLDKDVVDNGGKGWFTSKDAGTGPFMLAEWASNDHVSLVANPRYFLGAPKITRLQMPIVTQATTQFAEYQTGQLDLIQVPLADFPRIKADPVLGKQVLMFPRVQVVYLGLNERVYSPFKDARVRRAIAMSIDKDKIVQTVFFGLFTPARVITPPGIPGYYRDYQGIPYDPTQARALLNQAGMAGKLPPLTVAVNPGGPIYQMTIEPIAAMLKQTLGMDVSLQKTEYATFIRSLIAKDVYQAFVTGWTADYLDYSDYLDLLMYSKSRFDRVNYNNPDFDRIIDQANAAPTESQRIAIYHKAEEVAVQSAAMIPIFFSRTALLKKPYIQGLELAPWAPGYLPPANVTIQR
jgi:oligopeptide transport system substrate-binding protein